MLGFHTLVVAEVSPEQVPERIRKGLAGSAPPPSYTNRNKLSSEAQAPRRSAKALTL